MRRLGGHRALRTGGAVSKPERLVVGLGNPGTEYRDTRHNVGFRIVEAFAAKHGMRFAPVRQQARLAVGDVGGMTVAVLEPMTYMNLSGEAINRALRAFGLTPASLLVVYDDVDLPLGRLRLRAQGSAGGHKGLLSTIEHVGTSEFARLRVGVGHPGGDDVKDYVLSPFDRDEEAVFAGVKDRAVAAIECYLASGIEAAMNEYNKA